MRIFTTSVLFMSLALTAGCSLIDVDSTTTEATSPEDRATLQRLERRMEDLEDRLDRIESLLSKQSV